MKKTFYRAASALLLLIFALTFFTGAAFSVTANDRKLDTGSSEAFLKAERCPDFSEQENTKISSRFFELFFKRDKKSSEVMLCPSGEAFGILIKEEGITVSSSIGLCPLEAGDKIISINGKECAECEDIYNAVKNSGGKPISIEILRRGEKLSITVSPKEKDGEYRLGISLKNKTAGIGTITFVDPETLDFGGLGHSVSDPTGAPVQIKNAIACRVTLGGCKKGESGKAGELSGILGKSAIGSITKNTSCGIFGTLKELPENLSEAMPIARKAEVKEGEAEIISTVRNGKTERYKIEIRDINISSEGSKSFKVKVIDPALTALTGGIVRGMSGSPIIQDGKLVGAVTHVMVADPTEGYGIFIENMLSAAESQVQPKAA